MATSRQAEAAKPDVQRAAVRGKREDHLAPTIQDPARAWQARRGRGPSTGGTSPKSRAEPYEVAWRRDLPGRLEVGRDELAGS